VILDMIAISIVFPVAAGSYFDPLDPFGVFVVYLAGTLSKE
jgi:hypothetical protein